MTYLEQLNAMEGGRADPFEPLSITLSRYEWANLMRALRRDADLQPQLGQIAWGTICNIEFELVKKLPEKMP